jgi:formamidase
LISTTSLQRIVAQPPEPKSVHGGAADAATLEKIGKEGARTIPGRPEHGGNCDIKNLSRGSKVFLPIHVKGAKFSVGDLHFSRKSTNLSPSHLSSAPYFKTRLKFLCVGDASPLAHQSSNDE